MCADNSMPDENDKIEPSSYEKGINNLLNDIEKYEALIWAYVLRVNSNFHSNEFPSTQITKIIMANLGLEKTRFSLFHKVIRIILNRWEEKGICELVSNTRASSARKTKEIYRFNDDGLEKIKARFIDKCIEDIVKNVDIEKDLQVLKTREKIIQDLTFKLREI
jgi:DNA-binding PadR family transcriptional regulator